MIRRPAALALLTLLVAGLLAASSGCGARRDAAHGPRTAADSLSAWRARADSMDGVLDSLQRVEGEFAQPAGTSTYAAWLDRGGVRVIHEDLGLGARGSHSNRYYFERGVPRLAVETGMAPVDSTPRLVPFQRAMLFDDHGGLVAASKTVGNVGTWLADYEATAALDHARRLLDGAQDARSGRGPRPADAMPAKP